MLYLSHSGDILRQKRNSFISVIDNAKFESYLTSSGLRAPINNGLPVPGVLVAQLKPVTGILTINHINNLCWLTGGKWELANELIHLEDAVSIRKAFFEASHKTKPVNFCTAKALRLFDVVGDLQ